MYKACSKCGKVHAYSYVCTAAGKVYKGGKERELRSSYAWTEKSQEIRERAQFLCEVCRAAGVYTYKNLQVHHIVKVRDNEALLLDNSNLICLCTMHHRQADSGRIRAEYLMELAGQRETAQ